MPKTRDGVEITEAITTLWDETGDLYSRKPGSPAAWLSSCGSITAMPGSLYGRRENALVARYAALDNQWNVLDALREEVALKMTDLATEMMHLGMDVDTLLAPFGD